LNLTWFCTKTFIRIPHAYLGEIYPWILIIFGHIF
jgi:hypothetical protein